MPHQVHVALEQPQSLVVQPRDPRRPHQPATVRCDGAVGGRRLVDAILATPIQVPVGQKSVIVPRQTSESSLYLSPVWYAVVVGVHDRHQSCGSSAKVGAPLQVEVEAPQRLGHYSVLFSVAQMPPQRFVCVVLFSYGPEHVKRVMIGESERRRRSRIRYKHPLQLPRHCVGDALLYRDAIPDHHDQQASNNMGYVPYSLYIYTHKSSHGMG